MSWRKKKDGQHGTDKIDRDLAKMLKGGVIMDVTTPEQAKRDFDSKKQSKEVCI